MEEAPEGDSDNGSVDFPLDEVLFFLLENGVPTVNLYGWHEGWCMEKITDAFQYYKKRHGEKQRDHALAVALGASSLLSKKPLEKFLKEIDASGEQEKQSPKEMASELSKMMGVFDG